MTNLEMVQSALRELGDASAEALTAFVANQYGTKIEPRFIPLYRATLRDQERLEAVRQAARAARQAVADRPPAREIVPSSERASATRKLALELMAQHGLHDWRFAFNRCKQTLGLCVYDRRTIELSIHFVERNNPVEEIRDTILHEIAHALVGPSHGHDRVWKRKCLEIGARPVRCGHADMPEGRWRARCGACGKNFHRHRKPQRAGSWFCWVCGPERGRLDWNETPVAA